MSSSPWYMHLLCGISLPLQMCMRNRIPPPKDVHKSHIEMTKHFGILCRVYSFPTRRSSDLNYHSNMYSMKHNNIRMYACPTHKHDAMRTTKYRY